MLYNVTVARGWRNWQTRTFEGRMVTPCGFKSRSSHQPKTKSKDLVFFVLLIAGLSRSDAICTSKCANPSLRSLRTNVKDHNILWSFYKYNILWFCASGYKMGTKAKKQGANPCFLYIHVQNRKKFLLFVWHKVCVSI